VSGKVAVEQLSHLNYVVRYQDEQGSRTVDIDLVGVSPETRGLILGETIHLHVVDPHDFEILHEVINECKSLCSLSLRLDKISRDSFYGPAYIAGMEGKTGVKEDGIRKMREQYLSESRKFHSASDHSKNRVGRECGLIDDATFQQEKSSYAQEKSQNLARGEEKHHSHHAAGSSSHGKAARHAPTSSGSGLMAGASLKSHLARLPLGSNGKNKEMIYDTKIVVCSYCQKSKASSQETDFYLHPYVPRTFEGAPFFFCSSCIFNWKDYRDDAIVHGQLILDGEVNEEICALCSTTPEELVLCSTCPRSYCHDCLRKNLSALEFSRCQEDGDWPCMCCENGLKDLDAIPRALWLKVLVGNVKNTWSPDNWQGLWNWINIKMLPEAVNKGARGSAGGASVLASSGKSFDSPPSNNDGGVIFIDDDDDEEDDFDNSYDEQGDASQDKLRPGQKRGRSTPNYKKLNRGDQVRASQAEVVVGGGSGVGGNSRGARRGGGVRGRGSSAGAKPRQSSAARAASAFASAGFQVGSVVTARYKQQTRWYPGVIARVNKNNTVDIQYDDGEYEGGMDASLVKLTGAYLPPVDETQSETYFFSAYLQALEANAQVNRAGKGDTEDACFLCKDGGDLIECDWCPRECGVSKNAHPCKKVYHTYCLGYDIPDDVDYSCMRHLCDCCGTIGRTTFLCRYCPVSVCDVCASIKGKVVGKLGMTRYLLLDEDKHPISKFEALSLAGKVKQIACGVCMEMIDKSIRDTGSNPLPADLVQGTEGFWPLKQGQELGQGRGLVGPAKLFRKIKAPSRSAYPSSLSHLPGFGAGAGVAGGAEGLVGEDGEIYFVDADDGNLHNGEDGEFDAPRSRATSSKGRGRARPRSGDASSRSRSRNRNSGTGSKARSRGKSRLIISSTGVSTTLEQIAEANKLRSRLFNAALSSGVSVDLLHRLAIPSNDSLLGTADPEIPNLDLIQRARLLALELADSKYTDGNGSLKFYLSPPSSQGQGQSQGQSQGQTPVVMASCSEEDVDDAIILLWERERRLRRQDNSAGGDEDSSPPLPLPLPLPPLPLASASALASVLVDAEVQVDAGLAPAASMEVADEEENDSALEDNGGADADDDADDDDGDGHGVVDVEMMREEEGEEDGDEEGDPVDPPAF